MSGLGAHPAWCARGHSCGLGEHRAAPITFTVPGAGAAVLTRVRTADGREHAEIRLRVVLPEHEHHARTRLVALLTHLHTLIGPARPGRPEQRGRAA